MFSSTTTELSIKRENTSASPPSTMVLMVPPAALMAKQSRQSGERNGEQHGDGGTHATQKDQDHHRGQHQADAAFVAQVLDRRLDEHRLVEHELGDHGLGHVEQVAERPCGCH